MFGRVPSPRDRRDCRLGAYQHGEPARAMFWGIGPILDQGETPECCGFAWAAWSNAAPVENDYGNSDARAIYRECKAIDGTSLPGSTVRSGAKAMKARGRLRAYAFGTLDDARRFILTQGPVVFGTWWYEGMMEPDERGVIHATGEVLDGHAYLIYGFEPGWWHIQQSWDGWGAHGCARISEADMRLVFGFDGEACAAVELPLTLARHHVLRRWYERLVIGLRRVFGNSL